MVLNLYKIINETDSTIQLSNDENTCDNYTVYPGETRRRDCWLPMSKCFRVKITLNGSPILFLSDQNWNLTIENGNHSILRNQGVDKSKDFYLRITNSQAVFTCNGPFKDDIESFTVHY
ncbi:hypothetical protein RclHR1_19420001 [Rhizophagus clarus]|uniref:Uncharacterized protein n=1 Tax=Rhizophagus clarus TaxID=94130 RepID=A0A2Z6R4Q0_9GLOM|nr:hypothetical protein RclHR1_19420001 [Rhizophagus clarus]GET04647.1 hypothetical protein RCL_jg8043.t1 [Rhizophagus clarus]